ncbi:MAG TPA: hypothetical protein VMI35_02435 [Puia sp.]|nr:hypothetical protein [Puia sp.]
MKKLLIVVFAASLAMGASAQRVIHGVVGGGYVHARPQVVVGLGAYAPFYPYPYFGYGLYYPYYPYYPYGPYGYRPSRMTLQIEDIKNDYHDKIISARHDKTLTHQQRKETIHALKQERDQKIADLKKNYYKH